MARNLRPVILFSVLSIGLCLAGAALAAAAGSHARPWPLDQPPWPQTVLTGRGSEDYFGYSLATGDLNGDGQADLIVSGQAKEGLQRINEIYLLPGLLNIGLPLSMPQAAAVVLQWPNTGFIVQFLQTGDMNGDGYDDLVLGSFGSGQAYVYLGSPELGIGAPRTVPVDPQHMALTVQYVKDGLALCDLNGDDYSDLFVEQFFSEQRLLQIWGLLGHPGLSETQPLTASLPADAEVLISGIPIDTGFSVPAPRNLGCGDVDGDGFEDLVIGAYPQNPGGRVGAGRVYIVRGGAQFRRNAQVQVQMPGEAGAILEGVDGDPVMGAIGDSLGWSLAAADVNGDGRADLLLGAPGSEGLNNATGQSGEVSLWSGRELTGQVVNLEEEAAWTVSSDEGNAQLGHTLAAGDFDGDGQAELLLGCSGCGRQDEPPYRSGRAYLVCARQPPGIHHLEDAAWLAVLPDESWPYIGTSVAAADLNADGADELVVAGQKWHPDEGLKGVVYVLTYGVRQRVYFPLVAR